jgi:hypothetical protein
MQSLDELKRDVALIARHLKKDRPRQQTREEADAVFVKLRRNLDALGLPFRIGITPCSESDGVAVQPADRTGQVNVTSDAESGSASTAWPDLVDDSWGDAGERATDPSPYWSEPSAPDRAGRYQGGPVEF